MAGRRKKRSPVAIGIVALVVALIALFLGFTKDIPFTRPFEVKAVFQSANSIRPSSPVRIAGVEVGKVKSVEPQAGTNAAVVTLSINKDGLPIHADATAKIRPRIFLEGNFFVDLKPGTPEAPDLGDGDTIKVTQTATPVQLDEVLTALQSDSRQDLKDLLDGLAVALTSKPTAEQDAGADPSARGQSAAQSFNDAYADIPASERSTAQVFEALLGSEPARDVSRLITGTAKTTGALIRNENALKGLISNFNTTMAALASESGNLRASIHELAPTLDTANGTLTALNDAFPPTRAFAREILPGVRETPATIDASFPWIAQTRRLVSSQELGGLVRQLSPATADLARVTDRAIALLPQTDLVSKCVRDNILPTGDLVINDEFKTGAPNYKEFLWSLVGLSGEGQNFDGNGSYVRFQTGGGSQLLSVGQASTNSGQMFGNNVAVPLGNRPYYPGKRPPYRPDVPCYTQKLPDVNGPAAAKSAPGKAPGSAAPTPTPTPVVPVPSVGPLPGVPSLPLAALRKRLRPFGDRTATDQAAKAAAGSAAKAGASR
jgi:phospholipid/cholesterol/gamma-HCH transport system substrate-binding protein